MSIQNPLVVLDLKKRIQASHPFKPDAKRQRLLFGGKLLDNSEKLRTILEPKIKQAREFLDDGPERNASKDKDGANAKEKGGKQEAVYEQFKLSFTFHLMIFEKHSHST